MLPCECKINKGKSVFKFLQNSFKFYGYIIREYFEFGIIYPKFKFSKICTFFQHYLQNLPKVLYNFSKIYLELLPTKACKNFLKIGPNF